MATSTFTIKINGLEGLIADANKAGGEFPGLMVKAMQEATGLVQEDAKRIGPGRFKNQTGNLRRNIYRKVDGAHRGKVYVGEKYGEYVEFGTRPHIIRARKGGVLADKRRNIIFGKVVHHPGSKPYPFMKPAFENNLNKIKDIYDEIGRRIVTRMAGK